MESVLLVGQCIGDPLGLRILALLRDREALCACELYRALRLPRNQVDRRLIKMREAEVIEEMQHGRWLEYRLRGKHRRIVDEIFASYAEELSWDSLLSRDRTHVAEEVANRVDNWC